MVIDWRVLRGPRLETRPIWQRDDPLSHVASTVVLTAGGNWVRVHYLPGPHGVPTPFGHNSQDPDFVLVHGIGVSSRYFLPLAEKLSRIGDVYLMDLPGFASLPRPRTPLTIQDFAMSLDGIVGSLHLENPVFVGHSMGAQVVTELLVLGKQASKIVHEAGAVLVGPPVNAAERRLRTQLVRFAQSSRHESNEVRRLATNAYLACGVDWFATVVPSMMAYPIEERIRLLPCPVTFLRGEYDEVAPQAWIDFLGREAGADVDDERAGSCTHVTVHGAAHSVIYDHDEDVYNAVMHLLEHHAPT